MSRIKVNTATNKLATGPVNFPDGLTGVAATFTGNVTVGGTLSYEDVQNIDLMNLAGFCRNCLSKWYREEANKKGINITALGGFTCKSASVCRRHGFILNKEAVFAKIRQII